MTDCTDLQKLKQLTETDILLVTAPMLARGIDYRAAQNTHGIALLVMSKVDNQRAFI